MGKIGYLLKRIKSMDYNKMFTTINEIKEKTNKIKYQSFLILFIVV